MLIRGNVSAYLIAEILFFFKLERQNSEQKEFSRPQRGEEEVDQISCLSRQN